MSNPAAKCDPPPARGPLSRPSRESVLSNAGRLGDLIAAAGKSDAERRELRVHVGRLIAAGNDASGRGADVPMSDSHARSAEVKQGPLEEVYDLILETVQGRDALTLEQQLDALSVHLGALVATPTLSEEGRCIGSSPVWREAAWRHLVCWLRVEVSDGGTGRKAHRPRARA